MKSKELYGLLLAEFGLEEFTLKDLKRSEIRLRRPILALHRMCSRGYLTRPSRGVYRVTHPLILALEWGSFKWRHLIPQREYLPILEHVVAGLLQTFWRRLVSILIFGSVAAGRARPESDIDLLVVVKDMPRNYSDRLKLFREAVEGVEDIRIRLWRRSRIYPLVDPIILTPEEAEVTQPFYLDMVENSIIILDKGDFMRRKLMRLKERLSQLGARKVILPDGTWLWELKPSIKPGEVVEL